MTRAKSIDKIVSSHQRSSSWSPIFVAITEVELIQTEWKNVAEHAPNFLKYVPIRLVTCIEVAIRHVIKSLVDFGGIYLENSGKIWGNNKIDFYHLSALHGKKITIGDLVAHSVSLNSVDQMIGVLENLLPNFKKDLVSVKDRWLVEVMNYPDRPIVEDLDLTLKSLKSLFELRHIVAHELPDEAVFVLDEISGFILSTSVFLAALEWLTVLAIEGNIPLKQSDMNIEAFKKVGEAREQLEQELTKLKQLNRFPIKDIDAAHTIWLNSANFDADLEASVVFGGSMHSGERSMALANLYQNRLAYLRNLTEVAEF